MDDYLLTLGTSRLLKRSPDMVRYLARTGRLPAVRVGHVRLYPRRAVEQLAAELAANSRRRTIKRAADSAE